MKFFMKLQILTEAQEIKSDLFDRLLSMEIRENLWLKIS